MTSCAEIGKRIKELRELKGLTQSGLAEQMKELNIQRETVNRWENGTRDLKTEYTIALADYFNVTCDYILRGIKAENVEINKRLGLSDKAIEALCELKKNQDVAREFAKMGSPTNRYDKKELLSINILLENFESDELDLLGYLGQLIANPNTYKKEYVFFGDNDFIEFEEYSATMGSADKTEKINLEEAIVASRLIKVQQIILSLRDKSIKEFNQYIKDAEPILEKWLNDMKNTPQDE